MIKQVKEVPIYGGKLIFIDSTNTKKLRKLFPNTFDEKEEIYAHAIIGGHKGDVAYYILINSNHSKCGISHGTISHEAGHVTTDIFDYIGAHLDPSNQESFTYLLGYIVDEFYLWLDKNKIEIKLKRNDSNKSTKKSE